MQIQAMALCKGLVIATNGRDCLVEKIQITSGKGGRSVIDANLRDLRTGTKGVERFMGSATVTLTALEETLCLVVAAEDDGYLLMDEETFDQSTIDKSFFGVDACYLQNGIKVTLWKFEGSPISHKLPDTVTLQVTQTAPAAAGQAAGAYKSAVLSNGMTIQVPGWIDSGTNIVVSTNDGSYVSRVTS